MPPLSHTPISDRTGNKSSLEVFTSFASLLTLLLAQCPEKFFFPAHCVNKKVGKQLFPTKHLFALGLLLLET